MLGFFFSNLIEAGEKWYTQNILLVLLCAEVK